VHLSVLRLNSSNDYFLNSIKSLTYGFYNQSNNLQILLKQAQ